MNRNIARSSSNWTGTTARTLTEAFGPMQSGLLAEAGRNESRRTVQAIQFIVCAFTSILIVVGEFALLA